MGIPWGKWFILQCNSSLVETRRPRNRQWPKQRRPHSDDPGTIGTMEPGRWRKDNATLGRFDPLAGGLFASQKSFEFRVIIRTIFPSVHSQCDAAVPLDSRSEWVWFARQSTFPPSFDVFHSLSSRKSLRTSIQSSLKGLIQYVSNWWTQQ